MKREHSLFRWTAGCFSALAILAGIQTADAQGTAFTYQGRLNDGANPANGNYDIKFTLFGASGGGGAVAGPVSMAPVGVSNGLFTVSLDFGGGVFTGPVRWLEIGVRTNGSVGAYSTLGPRQQLTPAPYAIFAGSASNVASGSVVQSLNGLKDNVTLAAGSNVTITPNGNTLTIASAGAGGSGIWSVNANNAYYNAGNVGIGTASPQEELTLAGVTSYNNGLKVTGSSINGTGLAIENTSVGGHKYDFLSGGLNDGVGVGAFGLYDETVGIYRFSIDTNGNVGIGTYAPTSQLDIFGQQDALKITGYQPFLTMRDSSAGNARGVIQSVSGGMNLFTESYLSGTNPFAYVSLNNSGNVGIGSAAPVAKLEVVSQDALRLIGYQPFLTILDANAGYARSRIQGVNGDLVLANESYLSGANPTAFIDMRNSGNVGIGTANPLATLDVNGTTQTKVLIITGGADLAEPFLMKDEEIKKGSVVVIDEKHPGQLKLSTRAYDTHVAGIVSGANGINPGIALHQEGALEGGQNVALSGRVYAQADASGGAIEPGDLLTTSDTPGRAMKVTDHAKAQGAILGKAMSSLDQGKGMVLVLVTLQ